MQKINLIIRELRNSTKSVFRFAMHRYQPTHSNFFM